METPKETRKAKILRMLNECRAHLRMAAECRAKGATFDDSLYVEAARAALDYAQALMAAAPASTRRRWKHSECINTRKRYARQAKQNGIVGGIVRNGRKVYANV